VEVCPTSCRKFGDRDEPGGELATLMRTERTFVLRPEAATRPRVHYALNKNLDVVRIR
jgi:Fe-S-cluster-containing dehydrogenase component